ncbi:uracil-DNA glycosylase family protein [Trinickia sp. NRRL B-1857]|uniref:uracil-DNA glycosylase n=1 Tax=Trinickia sp. NRRL B-1857 TaxID=3162879 RepID=UPI003D2ADF03
MALDEAALETLGLGTMWVRRGAPSGQGVVEDEPALEEPRAAAYETASPAARPAAVQSVEAKPVAREPESQSVSAAPTESAPGDTPVRPVPPETAKTIRIAPAPEPEPLDEPAWDDFEPVPPVGFDPAPASAPAARSADIAALDWEALEARVSNCERCRLCEKRTNTVFGVGDRAGDWMLIGEGPGENEDKQGEPFVGQAGKLLDSMLRALSLARGENVYIANVVKCRPPGNRNPEPDEVAQCEPYLQRQVALVKPKLIIALGRVAAQNLLKTDASISSLRGRVHRYEDVPVIVTYHPAYLLRSLPDKAKAWVDLCLAYDTYRQAIPNDKARS